MRSESPWRAGAVLVLVLLAYSSAWQGVFQFDDYRVIVDAQAVHTLSAWIEQLDRGLRPLLKLSYLLNWSLDPHPWGFHAFNLLVHLGTTLIVYKLALRFGAAHAPAQDWRTIAWLTALIFAVHPVHTEAITYISGRGTSAMTLFYLAALWAHASGRTLWSLLAFALAVLVKESAMLLPLALLAWEIALGTPRQLIARRLWPWLAIALLGTVMLLLHPAYFELVGNSLNVRAFTTGFATQLNAAAYLIGKLFLPMALNIDPDLPTITRASTLWPQLLALGLLLMLAWRCLRSRPWISMAIAWVVLHLLFFNSVFPRVDIANERLLYWGDWALIFAVVVEAQRRISGRWLVPSGLALAGVLAFITFQRNQVYHSEISLWQDTAQHSPNKARVLNNLGFAYAEAGHWPEAELAYLQALEADPDYIKAINNLEAVRTRMREPSP